MPITMQAFEKDNSQENLKILKHQIGDRMREFFTDHLPTLTETTDTPRREYGLAQYISNRLSDSPFKETRIADRTVRRWVNGSTTINRFAAYQVCIAFQWGDEIFKEFFTYLGLDSVRFNDWREVLYFYCIQKKYTFKRTYELYNQCISLGFNKETGTSNKGQPVVTVLTDVIKNAYSPEDFSSDYDFINYMKNQKYKFHAIKNTRRKEIIRYIEEIKKTLSGDTLANLFAGAFYEDDDKNNNNLRYFAEAINAVNNKKKNFSREFFILCLLISGKNNVDEIKAILTSESRDYVELDPLNNLFDACVYEACKYHERNKDPSTPKPVFMRFCENTAFLKYKRPVRFAYDLSTIPTEQAHQNSP